jgi:hypothetical protein
LQDSTLLIELILPLLDLLLLLHHNGVLNLDLLLLRLLFLLELIYRLLQLVDVPLRVFYFSLGHVELVKHLRGLGTLICQGLL